MRAIILGSEFIGFLILGIISIITLWKRDRLRLEKDVAKRKRNINIINFIINFIIILSIFFFSFKSFIFLSVNKIIFVTFTILLSSIVIILELIEIPKTSFHQVMCFVIAITIFGVFVSEFVVSDKYSFEGKTIVFEERFKETIKPVELSNGKKIGVLKDGSTDKVERYMFYFLDEKNGLLNYKEFDMTILDGRCIHNDIKESYSIRVIKVYDKETYIEEERTVVQYKKKEKKTESEDYIEIEIKTTYIMYLNPDEVFQSSPLEIQEMRVEWISTLIVFILILLIRFKISKGWQLAYYRV